MTREELIERTWKMYVNEIVNWETHKQSFRKAVNAALDAQAHGTHKEILERAIVVGKEWMLVAEVLSIISSADPEAPHD